MTVTLSDAQRRVVEHGDGPILVVAGPGSGKTRVLTERVRRLLTEVPGHFRVLALTFTNKAAKEMEERLADLGETGQRAFVGTLHGFCLEMLADRGKPIGVTSLPQIFESHQDRRQVLVEAVEADPTLRHELAQAGDARAKGRMLDEWLRAISYRKAHPISSLAEDEPLGDRILEAYDAGLRACGAYDFDDLLLLAYRLLTQFPKVADFYRRLYGYVCVDEAQDLNEAQYAVIRALCGDAFRNVMMVGDPRQSIYGFNTASPKYMEEFCSDFGAPRVELTENFRSSRAVVRAAAALEDGYGVAGQLPIEGDVRLLVGTDETHEAKLVADELRRLFDQGHPDIEGPLTPGRCAVFGRTRYALLSAEAALKTGGIPHFKRLSSAHENESDAFKDLLLGLRTLANPMDRLHFSALAARWGIATGGVSAFSSADGFLAFLSEVAEPALDTQGKAVSKAIRMLAGQGQRLDIVPALDELRRFGDTLDGDAKRVIHDDATVLLAEWDQYLRGSASAGRTLGGFLSAMALGTTRKPADEGVALMTVHSAKGLEFDVVFIVGMADGVFPDYRAQGNRAALEEERRNAFVAVTRSRRLLYLSYPQTRRMPWGDVWAGKPSPYLRAIGLL